MNKVLIVLISSTSAFSLKTMLEKRYKIKSKILQTPADLASLGCSYCIEVDYTDLKTAVNLLNVSGITVRGVFDSVTHKKIY